MPTARNMQKLRKGNKKRRYRASTKKEYHASRNAARNPRTGHLGTTTRRTDGGMMKKQKNRKMPTSAEKTTEAKEMLATETKTQETTCARHYRQSNKPHPTKRIEELMRIDIISSRKVKSRNRKTTDNTSLEARNDNWQNDGRNRQAKRDERTAKITRRSEAPRRNNYRSRDNPPRHTRTGKQKNESTQQ